MNIPVSNLVRYIKSELDGNPNLKNINVTGEISNFHRHQSGHLYFTLKDEHAQISCVMFKSMTFSLRFVPKNGDKVILSASVSVFEQSGQMQLYVQRITLDGIGDLYAMFEERKKRLAADGYFDDRHKKSYSIKYPEDIGVIVGENSAAMSDIKRTFARRWPLCKVTYYPSMVQGPTAARDLIANLKKADAADHQAIIMARGGGSFEDLFCFNDEQLVKEIHYAKTIVVTGVGHEQDFTLVDFVADLRASTPTAAVELLTPDILDVNKQIDDLKIELNDSIVSIKELYSSKLEELISAKCFAEPYTITEKRSMLLDYLMTRLIANSKRYKDIENQIDIQALKARNIVSLRILDNSKNNGLLSQTMDNAIKTKLKLAHNEYRRYTTLLDAYSKENVLKRGYALVFQDGKLKTRKAELNSNDISIAFKDGNINARILED